MIRIRHTTPVQHNLPTPGLTDLALTPSALGPAAVSAAPPVKPSSSSANPTAGVPVSIASYSHSANHARPPVIPSSSSAVAVPKAQNHDHQPPPPPPSSSYYYHHHHVAPRAMSAMSTLSSASPSATPPAGNMKLLKRRASTHCYYDLFDNDDVGLGVHRDLGCLSSSDVELDLDDSSVDRAGGGTGGDGDNDDKDTLTSTDDDDGRMVFDYNRPGEERDSSLSLKERLSEAHLQHQRTMQQQQQKEKEQQQQQQQQQQRSKPTRKGRRMSRAFSLFTQQQQHDGNDDFQRQYEMSQSMSLSPRHQRKQRQQEHQIHRRPPPPPQRYEKDKHGSDRLDQSPVSVQHAAPTFGPPPSHLSLDGRDPTCGHGGRMQPRAHRGSYHNFHYHSQEVQRDGGGRSSGSFRVLKLRNLNSNNKSVISSSSCSKKATASNNNGATYRKLAQDQQNLQCAFALDRENDGLRATIEELEMIAIEKQALVKRVHYLEAVLDEWQDEREFNSMFHGHGHGHVAKGGGMRTRTTGECSNSSHNSHSHNSRSHSGGAGPSSINAMTPSAASDLFNEEDFHSFSNLMTLL